MIGILLIQMTYLDSNKRGLKEMIIQEQIGNDLVKTYSDKGMMIRKIGTDELYSEAIDPKKFNREYEETDIPIEQHDELEEGLEDEH